MAIGLLFSGQGAQKIGMGLSLYEASESAKKLYDQANEILGWDLKDICFNGPDEVLTETRVCQPALYVQGYAMFAIMQERGMLADLKAACGLSLGELTALAVAGVYDFETGLRLVAERGRLMQLACDATEGGMAVVIGGTPEAVATLCAEFDIEIANLNCPGQIVVSGEKAKVMHAVEHSQGRGFRMVKPLNVAGAYHSKLMVSAREAFAGFIKNFEFKAPQIAVYTNTTGKGIREPEAIKQALVEQIVSSVRFEACVAQMAADNMISQFYECGPDKALSGMLRRIDKSLNVSAINEFDDIPA